MSWRPLDAFATPPLSGAQEPARADRSPPDREATPARQAVRIIESARRPGLSCPDCRGRDLQRNGHANGLQRFRCRACRRTFNSLTGTPLARLRRKDKWLEFCATLLDPGTTVRSAAGRVGVHRNTSFRWRHRLLDMPKYDRQFPLRSVVEVDTIFLRESHKGSRTLTRPPHQRASPARRQGATANHVCVLLARDRQGRTHDALTGPTPLTLERLQQYLGPVLHADVLLVTAARDPYRQFAATAGMLHWTAEPQAQHPSGAQLHIENVSGYLGRLRSWLRHFRGVATRYLENYCGWRWALDGGRIASPEALLRCALGAFPSQR